MKKKEKMEEKEFVERELSEIMQRTFELENELNSLLYE